MSFVSLPTVILVKLQTNPTHAFPDPKVCLFVCFVLPVCGYVVTCRVGVVECCLLPLSTAVG